MNRPEQAIQRAVIQNLKIRRAPRVFAFQAAIMKGLGVAAGVPDIIAIRDGHCYALELKAEAGRPTSKQIETMAAMEAAGATVALATRLDAAIRQIERWGLVRGVSA